MKKIGVVGLFAILASACTAPAESLPAPTALNAATRSVANTPPGTVEPLKFESVGNAVGVTVFVQGEKIEAGQSAIVKVALQPLVVRVSRKSDGTLAALATAPWPSANVSEMQMCTAFDTPCELDGRWIAFKPEQEVRIQVDWIGPREFWVKTQFRDSTGAVVLSLSSSKYELPQSTAQTSARLAAVVDERTPLAAFPAKIQTFVAATRAASPVTGFVKIENGRSTIGGKAGSSLEVMVEFGASSPLGDVREMRVKTFGSRRCAGEAEMSAAAWEPLVPKRVFQVQTIPINFSSFDVSVQYRDVKGNLSPIYCGDIAVEGSP